MGVRETKSSFDLISWRCWVQLSSLVLTAVIATSCVTSGFNQAAAVNLELRFYRWDAVCITKPDTRENGFLPVLDSAEIPLQVEKLVASRNLAAIVIGNSYDAKQVLTIASRWHKRLAALGFRRVVVLRGTDTMRIAGLPILFDSAISSVNDAPDSDHPHAAAPAAPRADAAYPSIAAIR